ncbi:MAG TPA: lanthionine synthetase C family protein [Candidatus Angelobacter sp.]|nr:lanthionine synthetase C family protein [Candidatus Angelobacter sp.]
MPKTQPSLSPNRWSRLLSSDQSQAALASILEIASELQSALKEGRHRTQANPSEPRANGPQLGNGAAGIAVFFAYMEKAGLLPGARELALAYLDIAVQAAANQYMGPSLFGGFTGIGWSVEHVAGMVSQSPEDLSEIDGAVEQYVSHSPWKEDYDLISGLVGVGVYCLERTGSPVAMRSLGLIIDRLYESAERSEDDVRWHTDPRLLFFQQREEFPEGYYNVGVAHGIPGIIALLARCCTADIAAEANDKARWLLERSVNWLLRQKLPATCRSTYPPFFAYNLQPQDCRVAWCYGDAGVAATLMLAARHSDSAKKDLWEKEAIALARRAASRTMEQSGVVDACFCHGSAGLAHLYNRFYQATRDDGFFQAACYWVDRTLQYREPGRGAAGYSVVTADDDGKTIVAGRLNIIEGIAGIGLTLLAAITDIEPRWDRVFLADIPMAARIGIDHAAD